MSRKRLDRIVVVDVESTCWEGGPPDGQEVEIIEIGVCLLDTYSGERLEREGFLVKPEWSTVSSFCTRLTGITQEEVDGGMSFAKACSLLRNLYRTKERIWASYGDYDRRQFERQCLKLGIAYPFGPSHLNVKTLFALIHGLEKEVGMAEALRRLGLELEGKHHRGPDDAWNVAAILAGLILSTRPTS